MKFTLVVTLLLSAWAASAQRWEWLNPQPTGNSLNAVLAFSDSRCMAFGNLSTVLLTTDGGHHWRVSGAHPGSNLYDAAFLDSLHGWVSGGHYG